MNMEEKIGVVFVGGAGSYEASVNMEGKQGGFSKQFGQEYLG